MYFFQVIISVFARIALSSIFIVSGIGKIIDWHGSEEYLVTSLCDWHVHSSSIPYIEFIFDHLLQWVPILLGLVIFLEIFGGFLLLIGLQTRFGAFLLMVFLIPTTVIMHPFWVFVGSKSNLEMAMFMKNVAILGGLLMVLAFGNGYRRPPPQKREREDK